MTKSFDSALLRSGNKQAISPEPVEGQKRPIAVFDVDGTIFRSSLLIEVTNILVRDGVFPATIETEYNKEFKAWLDREASYEHYIMAVVSAFMRHIQGKPEAALVKAAEFVVEAMGRRTYRYTRDLIKSLGRSHFVVAISNSPEQMVSRFASELGFDGFSARHYEVINGRFSGANPEGNLPKDQIVRQLITEHDLTLKGSLGVGDTEGDIGFLELVERPIAFNPNSHLFTLAMERGWQIVVERKDVIYYYNE